MIQCLIVGIGGGIGAMFRYLLGKIPMDTTFPVMTLCINIIGAFVIGLVVGAATKYNMSEKTILFLKTGLCGGFTTFSTFSLESMTLLEQKNNITAYCYIVCSILFCLVGVWLGKRVFCK